MLFEYQNTDILYDILYIYFYFSLIFYLMKLRLISKVCIQMIPYFTSNFDVKVPLF